MLNTRRQFIALVAAACLALPSYGALSPSNPPQQFSAAGQVTTAVVAATLQVPGADGYNIILDGSAVGTSTITVAINVLNQADAVYVTPATIGLAATANPITLTNGTVQVINIPGSFSGIQVNVTSFGTATGTFRCIINAY